MNNFRRRISDAGKTILYTYVDVTFSICSIPDIIGETVNSDSHYPNSSHPGIEQLYYVYAPACSVLKINMYDDYTTEVVEEKFVYDVTFITGHTAWIYVDSYSNGRSYAELTLLLPSDFTESYAYFYPDIPTDYWGTSCRLEWEGYSNILSGYIASDYKHLNIYDNSNRFWDLNGEIVGKVDRSARTITFVARDGI